MLPGQLNLRKSILISSASSCGKMMEFRYVLRGFGSCGLEEIVNGFPHTFYKRCAVRRIPSIWFDPFLSLFLVERYPCFTDGPVHLPVSHESKYPQGDPKRDAYHTDIREYAIPE
jgi:hypothetical protein